MAPVTTILAHLLAAGLLASVPPAARAASPAPQLQQLLAAERLSAAAVSFVVIDAQSGQPVFGQNVDTPRSPASTIKLLTTFAGLDLLGPAYVWRTRALIRGELANGELDGDLILQGGGDPYMTLERWWSFARRLRATGLKTIRGGIVVDNQAFSLKSIDPGAIDGRPHRAYNAVPDALMVNFQSIEFNLVPDGGHKRVNVSAEPAPVNLVVDNRIRYTEGPCSGAASRVNFDVDTADWAHVTFTGALSGRCEPRGFTRVLLNPAEYAYGTFLSLWRELGGSADGGLRIEAAAADARVLLSFDSLPLGEIVRLTNKYSSNVMARHLLLTVGAERFGFPATVEKGIAAIDEWAGSLGLPMDGVEIDNGSGLSRGARVSVAAMGRLLVAAYHSRYAPEFLASLPLAGMDGTLRSRLTGTPGGAVRLKTGHLDGVSGVAGYVAVPGGRTYVLVSLINDPEVDSGAGDAVHATLVKWLLENP
jgi:D-alanyl-D-alanine carboxypeptidase/D-alanyl-D-alanine-endopeptidase (penicillin-binding protein 4)